MELSDYRARIDQIDRQLVELFAQRICGITPPLSTPCCLN